MAERALRSADPTSKLHMADHDPAALDPAAREVARVLVRLASKPQLAESLRALLLDAAADAEPSAWRREQLAILSGWCHRDDRDGVGARVGQADRDLGDLWVEKIAHIAQLNVAGAERDHNRFLHPPERDQRQ